MKKTITLLVAGAIGLVVLAKTTNLWSYASTAWTQVKHETKNTVPTKFEIERIRHEIAGLDGDVNQMIRPVAEYKVAIDRLRKEIDRTEGNVDEQRKTLLNVTTDLKKGEKKLHYGGKEFTAEQVKTQLARDFESFKRVEANLAAQRKLLESKEAALRSSQEQLVQVLTKKKDYELRLAQLEAENETLAMTSVGSEVRFDPSRAAGIEQSLRDLEDRIATEQRLQEMKSGVASQVIPFNQRTSANVDLNAIQSHLKGEGGDATASNSK